MPDRRRVVAVARGALAAIVLAIAAGCADGSDGDTAAPGAAATSTGGTSTGATSPVSTSAASTRPASTSAATPASPAPGQPVGFSTAQAIITSADGEVCEVCVWLADDPAERARGLMGVTDLGPAAGMVFAYATATDGSFYMFDTPTPLSIAWFAGDGTYVAEADMEPCLTDDSATCARYRPGAPYLLALEVFQGDLAALGVGPGATLELVADSEAPTCPDPG